MEPELTSESLLVLKVTAPPIVPGVVLVTLLVPVPRLMAPVISPELVTVSLPVLPVTVPLMRPEAVLVSVLWPRAEVDRYGDGAGVAQRVVAIAQIDQAVERAKFFTVSVPVPLSWMAKPPAPVTAMVPELVMEFFPRLFRRMP